MLVREVLELTLQPGMNIQQIAKHIDGLGEKGLRKALAQAGCVPFGSGKKGWHFIGDTLENLDKSIIEFAPKAESFYSASIRKSSNSTKTALTFSGENEEIAATVMMNTLDISEDDRLLDAILIRKVKEQKKRVYRGFYFEEDVLELIDSLPNGDKSDFINVALRKVAKEKGIYRS